MFRLRPVLLVALALSVTAAAGPPAPSVTVTLQGNYYTPDPIRLAAGQPVVLRLVNTDGKSHSFKARKFFDSARLVEGPVDKGGIDVAAGRSVQVTLVPAKGRYKVDCSHLRLEQMPMQGQIIVD